MADPEAATATQLRNIRESTGRTVAEWSALISQSGRSKHSEMVAYLKGTHGLTHGNANLLALKVRQHAEGGPASDGDLLEAQCAGAKKPLRPIYDAVVSAVRALGDDVTVVVQKTGVSMRRRKQFGSVQAPSAKRVELGLNLSDTELTSRLQAATTRCGWRERAGGGKAAVVGAGSESAIGLNPSDASAPVSPGMAATVDFTCLEGHRLCAFGEVP